MIELVSAMSISSIRFLISAATGGSASFSGTRAVDGSGRMTAVIASTSFSAASAFWRVVSDIGFLLGI